jgi:hypothetical protein
VQRHVHARRFALRADGGAACVIEHGDLVRAGVELDIDVLDAIGRGLKDAILQLQLSAYIDADPVQQ